jgi:hypothetical protein
MNTENWEHQNVASFTDKLVGLTDKSAVIFENQCGDFWAIFAGN